MGYRSDVCCVIYGEHDVYKAFITEQALILGSTVFSEFKHNLTEHIIAMHDGSTRYMLRMQAKDWKWYEGYPIVDGWNAFMQASEEAGLQYEFIRIGEETTDIEIIVSDQPYGHMSVHSNISEDFDTETGKPFSF